MPLTLTVGVSSEVPTTLVADKRAGVSGNAAVACANRPQQERGAWSCPGFDDTWTLPVVGRRSEVRVPRARPPYPGEFRREAIRLALLGDKPQRQLARDLGISDVTLRNWIKQERTERGERPGGLSRDEREELRRLRDENARLRMEREILSKAAVFFAKESDGR
jgi:transposase